MSRQLWALFLDNTSDKEYLLDSIAEGNPPGMLHWTIGKSVAVFSRRTLERFMDEEDRHDRSALTVHQNRSLRTLSSGEKKKALLAYIVAIDPDYIILDNPFDNLDVETQAELGAYLRRISTTKDLIFLLSRRADLPDFVDREAYLVGKELQTEPLSSETGAPSNGLNGNIPPAPEVWPVEGETLVRLRNVEVTYGDRTILSHINWTIQKGDFWQLRGKNGSGKTTLLTMITGENPKGYGQDLYLFGHQKGSGESVWDIKRNIGYFTPAMTDKFRGYHSAEHMLISGLTDSIGLYQRPTEAQLRLAKNWLALIGMGPMKDTYFHDLTQGQQRLVMTVRAMVKHPPLLILDEPTAGLDDASAALLVALVNKMAGESDTAIIFVSHRDEPGLNADFTYRLEMGEHGSSGKVL